MIKVGLVSLGCAKNLVDSEIILGMFNQNRFIITDDPNDADLIIVNTCGFIEPSKKESINTIFEMIKYHKKLVVVGCLVERYLEELKRDIPEVDLWVPIKEYKNINTLIEKLFGNAEVVEEFNPFTRLLSTPFFSAYLRISEGCNNRCTYCAIPLIRGSFVSRSLEDLTKEATLLASKGIKELVIISQDTTRYGSDIKDKNITIVTLLKELLKIPEFISIRLLYLYPDEISDELIDLIASEPRIAHYFDIPIQHVSDKILNLMHRRGNKELLTLLFNKIRTKIPDATLRSTYIVGFPGETLDDFSQLVEFTKSIKFDHLGVFKYSKEEGTLSAKFLSQVPSKIKDARYDEIMSIQRHISYINNKARIGSIMTGIVTSKDSDKKEYNLRSSWNAPDDIDGNIIFTSNKDLKIGDIVSVKIEKAFVYDLYGATLD